MPDPGPIGWEINKTRLAGGLVASDPETLVAVGFAYRRVAAGGGARRRRRACRASRRRLDVAGKTVVIVLSGGNIGDEMLADGIRAYRSSSRSRCH